MGATLVTMSLVLAHVTGLPLWLFSAFVLSGGILIGEGVASNHVDQAAARFERRIAAQAKAPKPQPVTITQGVPRNIRNLVYDWTQNKPTTRRYAEQAHGVTQEQWQRTVDWAVNHGLGDLVPAEGGAKKLRWTAGSLNDVLPVMDALAVMA